MTLAWAGDAAPGLADPALRLAPDSVGLLFAALFGVGVVIQLAGLWRQRRAVFLAGAVAVLCAALLDRDPVLAVGQTVVILVLAGRRDAAAEQGENPPAARTGKAGNRP